MARKEFIGWTGLAPIGELIEFIFGIRGDYAEKEIVWDMGLTEQHGIERYPFGPDGSIKLISEKRRSAEEEPKLTVESNIPFKLKVMYGKNHVKNIDIVPGKNNY